MSTAATPLSPAAEATLAAWHAMIRSRDTSGLPALLAPDAVFRSPMAHTPYGPAAALEMILGTVMQVFEDFAYHRELASDDGLSVVLEFSANVKGKALKGIDLIQFDAQGLITEFEVMVRPLSGLQALGAEMGERLAARLPAHKLKG